MNEFLEWQLNTYYRVFESDSFMMRGKLMYFYFSQHRNDGTWFAVVIPAHMN